MTNLKIQEDQLIIPTTAEELDAFLSDAGYEAGSINYK